ncbi:phosphate ABC transporter substrate-binding protein PstS [Rhodoplanes sp. Z2-YC6860]|uniref:phosphate ABC transporter substrate-binding protein PstS n=1 Tax=Rhodoplanes sp. Z2-YC6860 TaxID=674703 RepID=UPI00082D29C8|nr:phosphate ABC transporter substrate-binding protein PstS [Rhodoplanes sp. Z2-YC6860]
MTRVLTAAAVFVGPTFGQALAGEVTGAGSTFIFPILTKWSAEYATATGTQISYRPIGSGAGIAQIKSAAMDFGASDAPLTPGELRKAGLGQFPLVVGGIVPVVNIEGVKPGDLKFTGPMLADIFLGKIKTWNDPAIVKLNPELTLPAAPITVVHRLDGSGTTFNWTNYLGKASPEWREKVGEGTSVDWPVGAGGKGNDGVATFVNRTRNSIGYVEYAFALQKKLTFGLVQNKAGKFVNPNASSFRAAAASADWTSVKDFYLIITDAPGDEAYPVMATSFILMHKMPRDIARMKSALKFFQWALEKGQSQASSLDYVPLPDSLVDQIEMYWKEQFNAATN